MIPPDVRIVSGKTILWAPWTFTWLAEGVLWQINIPQGFEFDGASVPRILWTITGLTPHGELEPAALVHDYLYRYGGVLPTGAFWRSGVECDHPWTRKECDKLFARIMRESGVPKWRRRLAYIGVRMGGWRFFKRPPRTSPVV